MLTVSQDNQLRNDISRMVAISKELSSATVELNKHIKSQAKTPRFRGMLRGQRDPDISGATVSGINLIIISGGQAVVAWHELSPEDLEKVSISA